MPSRIKSIIADIALDNSMFEPNSVNCNVNNGKVLEYSTDFSERHAKPDFRERQIIPTFNVKDYSDEKILNMSLR